MLKKENRIFKNLYNEFGWDIENSLKRDDWKDTKDIINKGQPLVIAPEGTSETEENFTETSPGPFKLGAFALASQLKITCIF